MKRKKKNIVTEMFPLDLEMWLYHQLYHLNERGISGQPASHAFMNLFQNCSFSPIIRKLGMWVFWGFFCCLFLVFLIRDPTVEILKLQIHFLAGYGDARL